MNPLDALIDMYMMDGMTERQAINQVQQDVRIGRETRRKEEPDAWLLECSNCGEKVASTDDTDEIKCNGEIHKATSKKPLIIKEALE